MPARNAAQLSFGSPEPVLSFAKEAPARVIDPVPTPPATPLNTAEVMGMAALNHMCGDGSFPRLHRCLISAHWASRPADVGRGNADFAILRFEMFDGETGISRVGADLRDLVTPMPKRLRDWDPRYFDREFLHNACLSHAWERLTAGGVDGGGARSSNRAPHRGPQRPPTMARSTSSSRAPPPNRSARRASL